MLDLNFISVSMHSNSSWSGKVESLLSLLLKQDLLKPDIIGDVDDKSGLPINIAQTAYLEALWQKGWTIHFGKYSPKYYLTLHRRLIRKKHRRPDRLRMILQPSLFERDEQIKEILLFMKSVYEWGGMISGYICHKKDYSLQTSLPKGLIINNTFIRTVGTDISIALPGIFWANFFNAEYVRWFGVEKFNTLPCYRMEELPDGGRLVLTSRSPLDYDESGETQEALKKHLGRDAFGDIYNPTKPTRSPIHDGSIKLPNEYNEWLKHFKKSKK